MLPQSLLFGLLPPLSPQFVTPAVTSTISRPTHQKISSVLLSLYLRRNRIHSHNIYFYRVSIRSSLERQYKPPRTRLRCRRLYTYVPVTGLVIWERFKMLRLYPSHGHVILVIVIVCSCFKYSALDTQTTCLGLWRRVLLVVWLHSLYAILRL